MMGNGTDGALLKDRAGPIDEIADPDCQPAWQSLRLAPVTLSSRRCAAVHESTVVLDPFSILSCFRIEHVTRVPAVVIAMPMSGHYGPLLYDFVRELVKVADVYLLDWVSARYVPEMFGAFTFEESIASIIKAIRFAGPGAHLLGLCQSTVGAIGAATALHQSADPCRPASLILMGGPVDPFAEPTRVSLMLAMTPLSWFQLNTIERVSAAYPGFHRAVYPARTQQQNLLAYLTRQMLSNGPLAAKVMNDDGRDPTRFPFVRLYSTVKDLPEAAFLESIDAVYKRRCLWTCGLSYRGELLFPDQVRDLRLLTIAAPDDDIAAPGQTRAAHRLLRDLPPSAKSDVLLSEGGHFSLVHGATCRTEVIPAIMDFIARV